MATKRGTSRCNCNIYGLFFAQGIGVLLPWNVVLNALSFWNKQAITLECSLVYILPQLPLLLLMVKVSRDKGRYPLRARGSPPALLQYGDRFSLNWRIAASFAIMMASNLLLVFSTATPLILSKACRVTFSLHVSLLTPLSLV